MQDDCHQSNESNCKDASESHLTADNHTSTNCNVVYGFEVTHSNPGDDSPVNVRQLGSCEDHAKRTVRGGFYDVLSNDGQSRNNDRSYMNVNSDNFAAQDRLLQADEGAEKLIRQPSCNGNFEPSYLETFHNLA